MRYSKKSQYKEIADRVIYLLLFPGTKDFFIFHCPKRAVRDYYRQHIHGRYYKTKQAVENLKKSEFTSLFICIRRSNYNKSRSL